MKLPSPGLVSSTNMALGSEDIRLEGRSSGSDESRSLCVGQMQMRQSDFWGMQQSTWAKRMEEATKDVDNFAIQK